MMAGAEDPGSGRRSLVAAVTDTISVDTSGSLVDTLPHQQDSGSNQSGSDSGLGYTNTTSDSSSLNPKAGARHQLDVLPAGLLDANNNININSASNRNNGTDNSASNNPHRRITSPASGQLRSPTTSAAPAPGCRQHNNNSESACPTSGNDTSRSSNNNGSKPVQLAAKAVPDFASQSNKSHATACESSSARLPSTNCGISETGIVAQPNNKARIFPTERSKNSHRHHHHHHHYHHQHQQQHPQTEPVPSSSSPTSALTKPPTSDSTPPLAPVLKSLLKRPTSSASRDKQPKHKRNVSFNQTVIVFCEEIVTSSPPPGTANAVIDSSVTSNGELPEPQPSALQPNDYQDRRFALFEPTHRQYCDAKNSTTQLDNIQLERAIGESANNLDDKRLFRLLEDESLLESFHSQHDDGDDLSDEDFPGNGLNYLSIDAISDYDSDSESSSILDGKERYDFPTPALVGASHVSVANNPPSKTSGDGTRISNKGNPRCPPVNTVASLSKETVHQPAKIATKKLMPARMKVTPVDASFSETQNARENLDSNPKQQPIAVNSDRLPAIISQKPSTYVEPKNLDRSLIEPPDLSTNSVSQPEQYYSNVHEIINLSDTRFNGLQQQKLVNPFSKPKEYVTKSQLPQADTSTAKTVQPHGCCQICQLIVSQKSLNSNDSSNFGARSQAPATDEIATNAMRALHNNAQIDQVNSFYNSLPMPNRPTVLSQSCVSCRELSMKQTPAQPIAPNTTATQQVTPVTCQVVYLVDQKGNRIKALSVVRPSHQDTSTNSNQAAYRQLYVPTSTVLIPNTQSARGANGQLIKLDGVQQANSSTIASNSYNLSSVSSNAQHMQNQQAQLLNARKQVVYYIRQPLESQATRLLTRPGDLTTKTFPDAHEIRRLDGVKGPTCVSNLVNKETEIASGLTVNPDVAVGSSNHLSRSVGEDSEDPSFGFSHRPSVKVVANSIKPPLNFANPQAVSTTKHDLSNISPNEATRQTFMTGRSSHILTSQTLDRRSLNQTAMKESIPSTSSMNNINGTLVTLPSQHKISHDTASIIAANGNDSKTKFEREKTSTRISRWLLNKL